MGPIAPTITVFMLRFSGFCVTTLRALAIGIVGASFVCDFIAAAVAGTVMRTIAIGGPTVTVRMLSRRLRLGRRRRRRGLRVSADRALAVGIIRAVLRFRLLIAAAAGTGVGVRSVVVGRPGRPAAVAVRMRAA